MMLQPGFVLHRRAYAETSLLLDIFTAAAGRLSSVAKGARRGHTPRAALLQPFQPLWLAWHGRGEVKTLTAVEAAGLPVLLPGIRLYCAFYLNELLLRLSPREEPLPTLFGAYQRALTHLADCSKQPDDGLRHFELALLRALGYELLLERAADGTPIRNSGYYRFVIEEGFYPVTTAEDGVSGETLYRLAHELPLTAHQCREARALLRQALAPYLGPQPLRSRTLLHAVTRGGDYGASDKAS